MIQLHFNICWWRLPKCNWIKIVSLTGEKVWLSIAVSLYTTPVQWHSRNIVHVVSFPGFGEEPGNETMYANITYKFVNFRNASRVVQEQCGTRSTSHTCTYSKNITVRPLHQMVHMYKDKRYTVHYLRTLWTHLNITVCVNSAANSISYIL